MGGILTTILTNNISNSFTGYISLALSVVANYYIINDASMGTISPKVIATAFIILNISYFPMTKLAFLTFRASLPSSTASEASG
jgi:hypothetical protein